MARPLAILWDVDGTLADSEPVHDIACINSLKAYGIEAADRGELLGLNRAEVHRHLVARHPEMPDYETYSGHADKVYHSLLDRIKPMPNAMETCRRFAAQGRAQFAVSNSQPQIVVWTLEAVGLTELMDGYISCDGAGRPKPHPDPYQRALDSLGLDSSQAVAYEDSPAGCAAARAAGLFVIGVPENGRRIGAHAHFDRLPDETPEEIILRYG